MTHKLLRARTTKVAAAMVTSVGLLAGGVAGGIALADHTDTHRMFTGGGDTGVRVATDSTAFATTAPNVWQHVTGSSLSLTVPSGSIRLVRATFTAESFSQAGGSWCSVRIVAKKSTSTAFNELYPRAGEEFAFDSSAGGDNWEGNAMKRAIRVGSGSWSFRAQLNAVGGGSCTLDDWYFDIETHTAS